MIGISEVSFVRFQEWLSRALWRQIGSPKESYGWQVQIHAETLFPSQSQTARDLAAAYCEHGLLRQPRQPLIIISKFSP